MEAVSVFAVDIIAMPNFGTIETELRESERQEESRKKNHL